MNITRDNHYVPQWYQKGFLLEGSSKLHILDLSPDFILLPSGKINFHKEYKQMSSSKSFYQTDLYTTFFGEYINDDIEKLLFGEIDRIGAIAVRAFIKGGFENYHNNLINFFNYLDSQKLRTPKGLDWIKSQYSSLDQLNLMIEMQALRTINCTMWAEGVREIVSAKKSPVKFIFSDHPITIYNYAIPPESEDNIYPNDPDISLKASQTIFPLNNDFCLILTNLEYANNPNLDDPVNKRTFARNFSQTYTRTDTMIRTRNLGRVIK